MLDRPIIVSEDMNVVILPDNRGKIDLLESVLDSETSISCPAAGNRQIQIAIDMREKHVHGN